MANGILDFHEALAESEGAKRHLLLGNGFSIALFPDRFRYDSLLIRAKEAGIFDKYPELIQAFEVLETTDFEVVLESLVKMTKLIHLYSGGPDIKNKMVSHIVHLRNALVEAIAGSHPARLGEIDEKQFAACREFLNYFVGNGTDKPGCVYTLNYDVAILDYDAWE